MPVIYIPEEAAQYGNRRATLPDNNLPNLADMLQKRLTVKVQDNLAKFKLDIQTLRKGVKFLKNDQNKLRETPIHAILAACQYAFVGFAVLLFVVLIDLFTNDFINDSIANFNKKGLGPALFKIVLKMIANSNLVLEKLMIHEF